MEQVGRNQPCPCGSGKKYKKCCLKKKASNEQADYLWHKLRKANKELDDKLLVHAMKNYDREAIEEAWQEFSSYRNEEDEFDPESPHFPIFIHWYLYNWRRYDYENLQHYSDSPTIAESYLKERKYRVPEMERRLIELAGRQPYGFYEIKKRDQGKGFLLRNILLEEETYVMEQLASEASEEGCVLFAKVIQYEHVGFMLGCSGILIPPAHKIHIMDFREEMFAEYNDIDIGVIRDSEDEIFDYYFAICEAISLPLELNNIDGDPLSFHDMVFEIASAQAAFDGLKFLAGNIPEEELLKKAEFYKNGDIKNVRFPWVSEGDKRTISEGRAFGEILIEEQKLKVFANSENRARRIREKIETALGDQVVYKDTKVTSMEAMLDEVGNKFEDDGPPPPLEMTPELQETMDKRFDDHWNQWINEKLPALDGLSPAEAAKDRKGREKLAAVLKDIEMHEKQMNIGVSQMKYIERARKRLGISED